MRTLLISQRDVYGMKRYYPECDESRTLARICNTKTLTIETLTLIKQLSYEVEIVTEALTI